MPNRLPDPAGGLQPSTLTTTGDILYASSAQVAARLGIGSTNQVLGVTSGVPAYQASSKSTLTTTGDILYASAANTPARLAAGTSGYVLTSGGASTAPSWAAASSGALTFIRRSSFSGVATTTTTFDGIFTSTYKVYIVIVESMFSSTDAGILQLQFRAGATTKSGSNYYGQAFGYNRSDVLSTRGQTGTSLFSICELATGTNTALANITFDFVGNSSQNPILNGTFHSIKENRAGVCGAYYADPDTMTGLIFSASAGNITGTVSVYGLATA
jgi:hypothetical protein